MDISSGTLLREVDKAGHDDFSVAGGIGSLRRFVQIFGVKGLSLLLIDDQGPQPCEKIFPLRTKQGKKVGVCVVHDLKDLIFCNITVSKNQSIRSGQLVVLVDLLLILLAQLLPDPFSSVTS